MIIYTCWFGIDKIFEYSSYHTVDRPCNDGLGTASLSEVCHSVLSMKLKMVSLNHLDDLVFQQLEVDLQAWIGQMGSGLLDGASIIMWNGMPPSLTFFLLPQWTRFSGSFCWWQEEVQCNILENRHIFIPVAIETSNAFGPQSYNYLADFGSHFLVRTTEYHNDSLYLWVIYHYSTHATVPCFSYMCAVCS